MLTKDEAIQLAASFSRRGDHSEAVRILRQVHASFPGDMRVIRGLGISLANNGNFEDSVPYLVQVAQQDCNLDNILILLKVLRELRQIPNMDAVCSGAYAYIGHYPEFSSIWGYVKIQLGQFEEAEKILMKSLLSHPNNNDIIHNLSAALIHQGKGEAAVAVFSGAVSPWSGDGQQRDLNVEYSRLSLSYDENSLHHYFTDKIIAIVDDMDSDAFSGAVIDLGCGTGLLAEKLVGRCQKLIGVDMSPDMARLARERGGYTDVICERLETALGQIQDKFDVAVSAAVLCHVADLQHVFSGVSRLLKPGGIFVFSTDPCLDNMEIGISPSGDYCHSRRYLRRLAADSGLTEQLIQIDNHRGNPGFWCVFQK